MRELQGIEHVLANTIKPLLYDRYYFKSSAYINTFNSNKNIAW